MGSCSSVQVFFLRFSFLSTKIYILGNQTGKEELTSCAQLPLSPKGQKVKIETNNAITRNLQPCAHSRPLYQPKPNQRSSWTGRSCGCWCGEGGGGVVYSFHFIIYKDNYHCNHHHHLLYFLCIMSLLMPEKKKSK